MKLQLTINGSTVYIYILQYYHTHMGVFKDSLRMGEPPSTNKSKGHQGIARVSVSTIYNFKHTFLLVCTLTS